MLVSDALVASTPLVACHATQVKLNSTTPFASVQLIVGRLGTVVDVVDVVEVVEVVDVVVVAPVDEPAGGEALNNE
jgi:hypothetical protein